MAEILSLTASVVAILKISQSIISVCRDYSIALQGGPSALAKLENEVRALRDVLDSLRPLLEAAEYRTSNAGSKLPTLKKLCESGGALPNCRDELLQLERKLKGPKWTELAGPRRRAWLQALSWPFNEPDIKKVVEKISRYKATFSLALGVDGAGLTLAIHDLGIETNNNITELKDAVSDIGNQLQSEKSKEQRRAIERWLSAPDPSTNHDRASRSRQGTSGKWFLKSEIFVQMQEQKSLVWLYGIPGCGKTVLCSTVINELKARYTSSGEVVIAYFYFDFNDSSKQNPEDMARSLMLQFSEQSHSALEKVTGLYHTCGGGRRAPALAESISTIIEMIEALQEAFIILDALDECTNVPALMDAITTVQTLETCKLHTVVTSRNLPEIEESISPLTSQRGKVRVGGSSVDQDIEAYIDSRIHSDRGLSRWKGKPHVQQEIREALTEKADGMFRWAVCQLDALQNCLRLPILQKKLRELPKTLDETYSRILCSISEEYTEDALKILQWLIYSKLPMTIYELAEVVAVNVQGDPWVDPEARYVEPMEMISVFSGLITTYGYLYRGRIPAVPMVRLAHYSVQEYLLSDRIPYQEGRQFAIQELPAQRLIASHCIACLLQVVELDWTGSDRYNCQMHEDEVRESFPLFRYAKNYWYEHARYADKEDEISSLILKLVLEPCKSYPILGHGMTSRSPLIFMAAFTLVGMVELLLSRGANVNDWDPYYGTALHATLGESFENEATVQLLLASGADVLAPGGDKIHRGSVLHAAISGRADDSIIWALLEHGADINQKDSHGWPPLHSALIWQRHSLVELLLAQGADVSDALTVAMLRGADEMFLQRLISLGAEVPTDGSGNILPGAAKWADENVVRLLLDHGAAINAECAYRGNALQAAVGRTRKAGSMVRLLLERGANVNAKNEFGTALEVAFARGHQAIIQLLLDAGAQESACEGGEPLSSHNSSD